MASPSWLATQPPTPMISPGFCQLQQAHPAEVVEHPLLRLLAHRAGVEEDHVGLFRVVGLDQFLVGTEHVRHLVESYSFIWHPKVRM